MGGGGWAEVLPVGLARLSGGHGSSGLSPAPAVLPPPCPRCLHQRCAAAYEWLETPHLGTVRAAGSVVDQGCVVSPHCTLHVCTSFHSMSVTPRGKLYYPSFTNEMAYKRLPSFKF